jgi:hypothetical protein
MVRLLITAGFITTAAWVAGMVLLVLWLVGAV